MNFESFCRKVKIESLRGAADRVIESLQRISNRAWHPATDHAMRKASDGLRDQARSLEQRED